MLFQFLIKSIMPKYQISFVSIATVQVERFLLQFFLRKKHEKKVSLLLIELAGWIQLIELLKRFDTK